MGCKNQLDPREVLRRIIKNIIQRNLRMLDSQIRFLKTYDLAVWESVSQGFIRAHKFVRLSKRILGDDEKFNLEAREIISSLFNRAVKIMSKGKNPEHRARAIAKLVRTAIFIGIGDVKNLLDLAKKALNEIENDLERVKTASYLLFEIGRAISITSTDRSKEKQHIVMRHLEKSVQEIYNNVISWVTVLNSLEERAKALAFLAEGIRDLNMIVKREDNKVEWLDVHEAEILAQESLRESESISDFYARGIIKSYVAYLYYTLSIDLRDNAEKLYDEAIELALKNASKRERDAADLLGQIAFTKTLIGQDNESEILFQEGCIMALKCPEVNNILTALKIADLAGRSRMIRTAGELLDQYILPTIRSLKDGIKRAALMAIAADVATWVDIGWGARLAMNAAEEIWMHSPEDLKDGEQLYLLALGAAKAAFPDPDSAWRILDFLLAIIGSDLVRLPSFIDYVSLEWLGKAYKELKAIPAFWSVFKKELRNYLSDLRMILEKNVFATALLELAYGIGDGDKKYAMELVDKAIRLSLDTNAESKVFGKALRAAEKISSSLVDDLIGEMLKRAEQLGNFERTMSYLISALEEIVGTESSRKLSKIIIDIISETDPVIVSKSDTIYRFIKVLKKIDVAWANEIQDMIREERSGISKRGRAYSGVRREADR